MASHVIIAVLLFGLEAEVGLGILGTSIGFVMTITALLSVIRSRGQRLHQLGIAMIYAALCVATMGVILQNWHVAQHRAIPLISAIERFHSDKGRYPDTLGELCPVYLASVPKAGFTLIGRRYGYDADRPQLYFPAMFHGIVAYDFPTRSWRTNE